jgi:hypothetical protein
MADKAKLLAIVLRLTEDQHKKLERFLRRLLGIRRLHNQKG